jgi:Tat protein translocase TatB subunit
MDFLGIGPWELLLILILALILVGPGKIPEIARTLGRTIRAIKKASAELSTAVTRELEATNNELLPSQTKEAKPQEAPLATNKPTPPSQVDQPTKPGGASAAK